jgi:hypothetical protein
MDTSFLSYLLATILIFILILYLYQILPNTFNTNTTTNNKDTFIPIIFDTCDMNRKTGMHVHRVGPVINFHQYFNKYNNKIQSKYNTGIPEMGWRNYYLKHFDNYQVPEQDPFNGTPIRNFLNNLDNVDNIYRKCL